MGMYHHVYSSKSDLDLHVWKTSWIDLKTVKGHGLHVSPLYSRHIQETMGKGRGAYVRAGVLLQSMLRQEGYVCNRLPVRYQLEWHGKKVTRLYFGPTYLDHSCEGILIKFKEVDPWAGELLLGLIRAYPDQRWYLYGDDMNEPSKWRKATLYGSVCQNGRIGLDDENDC